MIDPAVDAVCAAAFSNNAEAVKAALLAHPDLNGKLSKERESSVLYTACRFGHLPLVQYLVEEAGCDVNLANGPRGVASTPLHGAAYGGHAEVVAFLAEHGAALAQNDYGDTPLEDLDHSETVSDAAKAKCRGLLLAIKNGKGKPKPKTKDRKDDLPPSQDLSAPDPSAPSSPAGSPQPPSSPKKAPPTASEATPQVSVDPATALSKWTVVQLKAKCKALGLPDAGTKAILIRNIEAALAGPKSPLSGEAPSPKKAKVAAGPPTEAELLQPLSAAAIAELRAATFTLTEVPKDSEAFWDMEDKFKANIQGRIEDYVQTRLQAGKKPLTFLLWKCEKVTNEVLTRRFERRRAALAKEAPEHGRERVSFHGTNPKHVESICRASLLRFKHPLNPCKTQSDDGYFGSNRKGIYVSRYSDYTYKYCNTELAPLDVGQTARVIMFRTLPGKTCHIKNLVGGIDPTPGYHSHSSPNFMEWYLFNEDQLCPDYVLTVKAVEDARTVADDEEER